MSGLSKAVWCGNSFSCISGQFGLHVSVINTSADPNSETILKPLSDNSFKCLGEPCTEDGKNVDFSSSGTSSDTCISLLNRACD